MISAQVVERSVNCHLDDHRLSTSRRLTVSFAFSIL